MKNWTFRWIRLFCIFWSGYFIAVAFAMSVMGFRFTWKSFMTSYLNYVAFHAIPAAIIFLLLLAGEYYSYKKGDAKKK